MQWNRGLQAKRGRSGKGEEEDGGPRGWFEKGALRALEEGEEKGVKEEGRHTRVRSEMA